MKFRQCDNTFPHLSILLKITQYLHPVLFCAICNATSPFGPCTAWLFIRTQAHPITPTHLSTSCSNLFWFSWSRADSSSVSTVRGLVSSGPPFQAPGLTVHATIALSKTSVLWKHTSRYISFEEITRSLMKYAKKYERWCWGGGVTWQPIARGALVRNVHSWTKH